MVEVDHKVLLLHDDDVAFEIHRESSELDSTSFPQRSEVEVEEPEKSEARRRDVRLLLHDSCWKRQRQESLLEIPMEKRQIPGWEKRKTAKDRRNEYSRIHEAYIRRKINALATIVFDCLAGKIKADR